MFLYSLFDDPIYTLRFILIIVGSITLHELGHGAAAIYQGDNTPNEVGHMTLNPVAHMGWPSLIALCLLGIAWGEMPVRPRRFKDGAKGRMLVAAAGPMMNFALAALCIFFTSMAVSFPYLPLSVDFLYLAANINVGLALFNLLPVPPLDGFSIFVEVFPDLRAIDRQPIVPIFMLLLFMTGGLSFIWHIAENVVRALT